MRKSSDSSTRGFWTARERSRATVLADRSTSPADWRDIARSGAASDPHRSHRGRRLLRIGWRPCCFRACRTAVYRDADLAVALASDTEAEALIHRLRAHDYRIEAVVEQKTVGRLGTVRLTRSSMLQPPVIDLLFASSGIEPEIVAEAEPIELLPNFTIGVARAGDLIALKVLSRDDVGRPQDLVDLRALLRIASPAELERARQSLALIASRGYHRGRDLASDMNALSPLAP